MDRYLDAVNEQGMTVILNGYAVYVSRARLGAHLQLTRMTESFDAKPDVYSIWQYFKLCRVDINKATGLEILIAFAQLRVLNGWQWTLPFMSSEYPVQLPEPYDYKDRVWSWWIHKLASRYGWSRDEIFDLWPEEAACYLQEIFVSEFNEADERRSLSELAYQYDKNTKTSRYLSLSKPPWMTPKIEPRPVRILRAMLPMGVAKLDELLN